VHGGPGGGEEDPLPLSGERGAGSAGVLGPQQHPEPTPKRHPPGGVHPAAGPAGPEDEPRLQLPALPGGEETEFTGTGSRGAWGVKTVHTSVIILLTSPSISVVSGYWPDEYCTLDVFGSL